MIIVLDTNVLVSGIFWTGNEAKILEGCKRGDYTNIASPYTLEELEKTISKKRFALTREEIEDLVELVLSFSMIVIPTQKVSIIKKDPSDNMFIDCALAADAKYIISGDAHLLDLGEYKGIKILTAKKFLREQERL